MRGGDYKAARHISFGAGFLGTFLMKCYVHGANPDRMLERFHDDLDFMDEVAQLAVRHLLPECECPQLADEPLDQRFGYPGMPKGQDAFLRMLDEHFVRANDIDHWLPREGTGLGVNDRSLMFAYYPGQGPSHREFFMVELRHEVPLDELLEILKRLHWGCAFLYDLVRVRGYTHTEPLFALGSHLRVMHYPEHGLEGDILPCVSGLQQMHMRTHEGCSGRTALCKGWRLLLWRKAK